MSHARSTHTQKVTLLLAALVVAVGVGLGLLAGSRAPVAAPPPAVQVADAPEAAAPAEATPATPWYEAWPKWGGAWTTARENGEGFFELASSHTFKRAAPDGFRHVIHLNARAILPDPAAPAAEALPVGADENDAAAVYLQFENNPSLTARAELKKQGVRLVQFVSGRAWLATGTVRDLTAARGGKNVRGMAKVDARDKLAPSLFEKQRPAHALTDDGKLRTAVLAAHGTPFADLQAIALAHGATLLEVKDSRLGERFELIGDDAAVRALAADSRTFFVRYAVPLAVNRDAELDEAHNVVDVRDNDLFLDGAGITVAVRELKKPVLHEDFEFIYFDVEDGNSSPMDGGHATAVFGQVGGDGFEQPDATGVAFGIDELLGYDREFPGVDDFEVDDIIDAFDNFARISNHSYGPTGTGDGTYNDISADWDDAMHAFGDTTSDLSVFMASTETGNANFTRIDFFVGCKNSICVTASTEASHAGDDDVLATPNGTLASFADKGPMLDGRVKPDIAAVGVNMRLLQGTLGIQTANGTSFSTPAVTGMAALVAGHYLDTIGDEPSAAMLKGILLNSATDTDGDGPDQRMGYGIANVERAASIITRDDDAGSTTANKLLFEDTILDGAPPNEFTITVGTNDPLKVMLVWLDPAGSPLANPALVNDLDLEVEGPAAAPTTFFPYSLNPSSPSAAATATGANSVDCVEQIILPNPTPGQYTIRVKATDIPDGPQSYAIVLDKGEFGVGLAVIPTAPAAATNFQGTTYFPVGGGTAQFTVTANGGVAPYDITIDYGDGMSDFFDNVATLPLVTTHVYPPGAMAYEAQVTFVDDGGAGEFMVEAFADLEVLAPPTASILATPTEGEFPLTVFFNGSGSSGVIDTAGYAWDFDVAPPQGATGPTTMFTYNDIGDFFPSLTVTDIVQQTSSPATETITVTKRNVNGFGQKMKGSVKFGKEDGEVDTFEGTGKLQIIFVDAELAFTKQQRKAMIDSGELNNRSWTVGIGDFAELPVDSNVEFGPFITDAKGRAKLGKSSLKIDLRKGWIVVKIAGEDGRLAITDGLFLDDFADNSNDPDFPTLYDGAVQIDDGETTLYNAIFPERLFWKFKGRSGRVKSLAP